MIKMILPATVLLLSTGCSEVDRSRVGVGQLLPDVEVTNLVSISRDAIRANCPEAAEMRVEMTGDPSAYARFNYVTNTIELTSSWEKKASKEVAWGGRVIAHEWAHSLQDPYYSITDQGEREASEIGKNCT